MGYRIIVNGEKVWESEQDAIAVDYVSVRTSRGEMGRLQSASDNEELEIEVNIRDKNFTDNLDMLDAERAQARRDRLEEYAASGDMMVDARPNTETVAGAEEVYGPEGTNTEESESGGVFDETTKDGNEVARDNDNTSDDDLDLGSFSTPEETEPVAETTSTRTRKSTKASDEL